MTLDDRLRNDADELAPGMIEMRHDLHRHPEIGLDLPRTQQAVLTALEGLPLEIAVGTGCTSVTAVLRGTGAAAGAAGAANGGAGGVGAPRRVRRWRGTAGRRRPCCCAGTWTRCRCRRTPGSSSPAGSTGPCTPA